MLLASYSILLANKLYLLNAQLEHAAKQKGQVHNHLP